MSSAKPPSSRSRRDKDESANPDMNVTSIGNYMFVKTLGEGNFAKVKLAKHNLTGVEVAVKIIDKTTLDEKKLSKLYREVRIMKLLHHPNIVKLYEVIETKSTLFLVMEHASGGELYDYLVVHGKMKEKEARAKFRQILSAVSYCHKKRVIHRDLKAENLLLDANLDIKIADFGFSNYYDPESKLDTFCGSPPYAAPELFQGRRYTGPEVDIWSLGVILYVLTTGCLPFDGKNLQEMRESVCRGKYRIPFYLSDSCEKLLRKFLVRDPYKRAGLEMLIDDPWINDGFSDSPISTDVSQKVEDDEGIIKLMETKYHVDRETILQKLRDNVYDEVSSIYYLLYYEKDTRAHIAAELAASPTIQIPSPINTQLQAVKNAGTGHGAGSKNAMAPIDEDAALQDQAMAAAPETQRSMLPAAQPARRRRFTVGGQADVPKYADSDEENKQQPAKDDSDRPAPVGVPLPGRPTTAVPSTTQPSAAAPVPIAAPAVGSPPSDGSETPQRRKRHNTIVGILRGGLGRRPSEAMGTPMSPTADKGGDVLGSQVPTIASNPSDSPAMMRNSSSFATGSSGSGIVRSGDENKPRSLRFTFNSNTTSSKPPDEIVQEVANACTKHGVQYRLSSRYLVECTCTDGMKFEVEICKLPRLKNLHGLRFKRVSGPSNEYKDVCEKILASVAL